MMGRIYFLNGRMAMKFDFVFKLMINKHLPKKKFFFQEKKT